MPAAVAGGRSRSFEVRLRALQEYNNLRAIRMANDLLALAGDRARPINERVRAFLEYSRIFDPRVGEKLLRAIGECRGSIQ